MLRCGRQGAELRRLWAGNGAALPEKLQHHAAGRTELARASLEKRMGRV
jgi:hypothetical protein